MSDRLSQASRQVANMLAVRAVRQATDFLQGRDGPTLLGMNADALQLELLVMDPAANGLLNPVRLLNVAMMSTARVGTELTDDPARLDRWMHVVASLVELVQHERARFASEHSLEQAKRSAAVANSANDGASP
ncbi:hypothetical protein EOW77_0003420 [Bradyrhizobium yuanmingense]|uniref:hypothetical protein n=1 Tax=Bradyrhizobium yuanmingense TaxID=108015 RepID=UPI000FE3B534|nr:hypothetical protein [Bradyrhizobium yuanmingense]TGN90896.1 hypothetical protein EOW77_0003420 [Bradyrhizobium yuanmingense]